MSKEFHDVNCSNYFNETDNCNETGLGGVWVGTVGALTWTMVGLASALIIGLVILFALRYYFRGPTKGSDNPARLDDRTVAITGCNTGIGKVTAHELSKKGARIIMLCRNTESAESAAQEIRQDTGGQV